MKTRIPAFALALCLIGGLCSCGASGDSPSAPAASPSGGSEGSEVYEVPGGGTEGQGTSFVVDGSYQYLIGDPHDYSSEQLPILGLNIPEGWAETGLSSIKFSNNEGPEYFQHLGFAIPIESSYSYSTYLFIDSEPEYFYGGSPNAEMRVQINGEYIAETPFGEWTVSQAILWEKPRVSVWMPVETEIVDGEEWCGYYAEVAMVENNGHTACICLRNSEKTGTYLQDIFAQIF